jgi:hypothetical protein
LAENDMMREMRQELDQCGQPGIAKAMGYQTAVSLFRLLALRLVVVLPLLTLGLFPAGVMPGRGADGGIALVLCSGNGPLLMVLDPATGSFRQAQSSALSPETGL